MTTDYKELLEEKFKGVYAMLEAHTEILSDQQKEIIAHQKITNGRVNTLEEARILDGAQHEAIILQLEGLKDSIDALNDRGIGFWLWFSDKKTRLLLFFAPSLIIASEIGRKFITTFFEKILPKIL